MDEIKVLIRNKKKFFNKKILFSGIIENDNILLLNNKKNKFHIQQYYKENILQNINKKDICFRSLPKKKMVSYCNILIFFWIRNKTEAKFQLTYLFSIMNINQEVLIIGKKNIGINSVKNIFKTWICLKKIDIKHRCILYYGILKKKKTFKFKKFIKQYTIFGIKIKVLPGLFDYNGIDKGSLLMISTFQKNNIKNKVLDIGSGSGILSIILKKISPNVKLTLVDNNSTAIICSKYNLIKNKIQGNVIYSHIYSEVKEKFNLIISNPPTHYGNMNNNKIIYEIIQKAKNFLYTHGILRIVIHSYIPCQKILNKFFGNYKIIKHNDHFNVYESILI